MLQIKHLTLIHRKDLRTLVDDLSFVLHPGDKAAVIGAEGNGKSSILKWIYDPALVESYCQWSGELARSEHTIGYLAQEISTGEKRLSVYEYCAQSPGFSDLDYRELNEIARQTRMDPGVYYSEQPVGTLSGGEQIKLQLSRLLFAHPTVLLLDEPSSDLDLETLHWLEDFIQNDPGIILYISHDETLLENTATAILHIEHPREGKPPRCTFQRVGYRAYADRRVSGIATETQQARKDKEEYDKKMERYQRIQQSVEHAQGAVSRQSPSEGRLLKKKMHTVLAMGRRFARETAHMTPMPEVEEEVFLRFASDACLPAGKIVLDYHLDRLCAGKKLLAENIRLCIHAGEKIGIAGSNGVGKTTLLRLLAQALLPRRDIKAAYMPQDYADVLPLDSTPIVYLAPSGDRETETRARTYLGSLRYTRPEMNHPIRELSGGQKAKLLLAEMMLSAANVLILDEPTRNFSPLSGPHVRTALRTYGGTIIAVSHDRKFLSEVCSTVYLLTESGLRAEWNTPVSQISQ